MEPSASVVACVYDDRLACTVFAQHVREYRSEALGIHTFYVYISDSSSGKLPDHLLALPYPSFVKVHLISESRLYIHVHRLFAALLYADEDLFASLHPEKFMPVASGLYLDSVDRRDDVSFLDLRIGYIKRSSLDYLFYFQTVTLVFIVVERAESTHVEARTILVSCTGVGSVQLTEHFREHLLEIEVVVDVRQELSVCVAIICPVNSMNVRYIELLVHLFPYMVEDVFSFSCRLVFEFSAERNVLPRAVGCRYF